MIGIYCILNNITKQKYIGQSININKRLSQHKSNLVNNRHINIFLQNSFNKYGFNSFEFYVLEECNKDYLNEKEKYQISLFMTRNRKYGFNLIDGGTKPPSCIGRTHSEYTKMKISKSNKGRKRTQEFKDLMSIKSKGNKNKVGTHISEKQKELLRIAQTGRKHTKKHRQKINNKISGVKNYRALFNKKQILEIRNLYENSHITQSKIAEIFSTKQNIIQKIVKYSTYKNI